MSKHLKKLLALLLALLMIIGILPVSVFALESKLEAQRKNGKAWDRIYEYQNTHFAAKRAKKQEITYEDYCSIAGDLAEIVKTSDDYVEGSCTYDPDSGNAMFFWDTTDGEACGYSPTLSAKLNGRKIADPNTVDVSETISYAKKGGSPSGGAKDVYVIGPWYGSDSSFTNQYKTEGQSIANASGGTYTLYSTTSATLDNVAGALQSGAVVIFDSHGVTDYDNALSYSFDGDTVYDSVTQANTSYLTLTTGTGWTSADKASVTGTYGSYKHAWSFKSTDGSTCYCVDGTAICNHMSQNAPNNMLWMAICLGMATNGLNAPLHAKGVEVVYGYSQSVTFTGDYQYEADFWNKIKSGENVKTAFAYMTRTYKWDPAYASDSATDTIGEARYYMSAFPNVVSSEDTYQGQRSTNPSSKTAANSTTYNSAYGACNLQTVNSTWTLFNQYTVNATSSNTSYGTVSVSGTTITASPKSGYYASGYTVTSGTATVVQNGNTFTVTPSSDCTIRINFAAKTACTLTYMANGSQYSTASGYAGDAFTLPSSATTVSNWTFAGWSTAAVASTTDKPDFYEPGASFTPTGNTTLYAVYTQTDPNSQGTGSSTDYELTDTLDDGDYVFGAVQGTVGTDTAIGAVQGALSGTWGAYTTKTPSGGIISEPADDIVWTLESVSGGITLKNKDTGKYLSLPTGTGSSSGVPSFSDSAVTIYTSVESASDSTFKLHPTSSSTNQLACNFGSGYGYRMYATKTQGNASGICVEIRFYKQQAGATLIYTTSPVNCAHSSLTAHTAVAATCGTAGNSAYWECNSCHAYFSDANAQTSVAVDSWVIPATGNHNYNSVVTAPTTTEQGYTTYTCTVCGDSYVGDYTPATGADFTVSFSVPSGVAAVSSMTINSVSGDTLPTAGAPEGYEFLGWVTSDYAADNTAQPGTILTGTYYPTANITLKALYKHVVSDGSSSGSSTDYELTDTLDDGDYVFGAVKGTVAADTAIGAVQGALSGTWGAYTATTPSGGIISEPADNIVWTLENVTGGITLKNKSTDKYLSLPTGTGSSSGVPSFSDSAVTIYTSVESANDSTFKLHPTSSSTNQLACNFGSGYGYRMYATRSQGNDSGICVEIRFYKQQSGSSTTYYTTVIDGSVHSHNYVGVETTAASCTTTGLMTYTCSVDGCGDSYTEVIPALGHNYGAWTVTQAASCTAAGTETSTCSRCGAADTREIAALGHDYVGVETTAATCVNAGVMTYTCSRCSDSYTEAIAATGVHSYVNGVCSVCGAAEPSGYELTATLSDGEYVFGVVKGTVGTDTAIGAVKGELSGTWGAYTVLTPENGLIASADDIEIWTLTNVTGGITLQNKSTGKYLSLPTGTGSGSGVPSFSDDPVTIYYSVESADDSTFKLHPTSSSTNQLACNFGSGYGYRMYATRSQGNDSGICVEIRFYKAGSSVTPPTPDCDHADAALTAAVAATCTAAGTSAYWYCPDCDCYFADDDGDIGAQIATAGTVIPAFGHNYEEVDRVESTCQTAGYVEYECSRCHDSYQDSLSLGDHNFVNGICSVCGATQPSGFELTATLEDGEYVFGAVQGPVGTDTAIGAVKGEVANNWGQYTVLTPDNGVIAAADVNDIEVWTLTNVTGGITLQNKSTGKYLSLPTGTGSGSGVPSFSDDPVTIYYSVESADDSTFKLHPTSSSTNQLACNFGSGYGYRMYATRSQASNTTGICVEIRFFKESAPSVDCDHTDAEFTAENPAGCITAGVSAYWYCPDCGFYYADDNGSIGHQISTAGTVIPALGHDYQEVDRVDATCVDAGYVDYECSRCQDIYRQTLAATGIHVDANSDDVCDVCGDDMPLVLTYALTTTLGNYDQVVIYYPTSSLALSTTASGTKLAGVSATPSNNTLTVEDDAIAVMTVEYDDNTNFYLKTADGKYLTAPASGNGLSFETSAAANDCSLWYLTAVDTTNSTVSIQNVGAAYNNNHNQALEYYNGFTTYGIKTTAAYTFQLYSRAHVHSWNEGAVTTEATCTAAGVKTYTCTVCGETRTETVEALGHDYVSHNAQDPTCTEIGWAAYETCTRCDYTNYTEIPATGHSLTETPAVTETCTSDGNSAYWTCSYCSKYFSDASGENEIAADSWVIPATGHSLTETPAEAATCTTDGNSAYWTCDYCNKYYSDEDGVNEITMDSWVIYATGHTHGAPVEENRVEPTVTAEGSYDTVVYCSVCGEEVSRVPNTIEKLKVEVVGTSLTTEGDVLLNAYLNIPDAVVTGSSDLKVKLYDENDQLLKTLDVNPGDVTGNGYRFQLNKPAKNMHDEVTLKLFDGENEIPICDADGNVIDELTYSVQGYLNEVINHRENYSDELYALCIAMSNYGSYAQAQQNFETETTMETIKDFFVNGENIVDIANVTKAMVTTDPAASVTDDTAKLRFYGASLVMESEMVLRFYFWYNGSGTLQANGTDLQRSGSSRYYYYDVTNIKASDFDEGCGFTVTDGSNSITVSNFSVYTYILSVLNAESGTLAADEMQNLVRSIVIYGKMAEAFYATQKP